MAVTTKQIQWSASYGGVSWSKWPREVHKRFSIAETTDGFTVVDHATETIERTSTLTAARAWAGIRVNEQVIRH